MDFFLNKNNVSNTYRVARNPNAMNGDLWPGAMDQMIAARCAKGPAGGRLEINAHGAPGLIAVDPWVTLDNLDSFAVRLRRLMLPSSLVEVLSCYVAGLSGKGLMSLLLNSNDEAEIKRFDLESHQGATTTKLSGRDVLTVMRRAIEMGPLTPAEYASKASTGAGAGRAAAGGRSLVFGGAPQQKASTDALRSLVQSGSATPVRPKAPQPAGWSPAAAITQKMFDARNANGPYFCSRLARMSGCRIRAASYRQIEESEDSGDEKYDNWFGKWEGHVMDFLPSGDVRYVGFNVRRPVYKTHDQYGEGPLRIS